MESPPYQHGTRLLEILPIFYNPALSQPEEPYELDIVNRADKYFSASRGKRLLRNPSMERIGYLLTVKDIKGQRCHEQEKVMIYGGWTNYLARH